MSTGIFIGTIIFIGIGMGVSVWLKGVVSNCTKNLADLKDNLLLTYVSCAMGTVCFWLLWFCMYMHQLHPMITPVIGHE